MGSGKKEKSRLARQGKSKDDEVKGENFYRDAKKLKRLNMYKEGKPIRNKKGDIVQAASFQSRDVPTAVIQPDRRWFNNTRVISQDTLASFREAIAETKRDPHQVLLKQNKLPMSLIRDGSEANGLKRHHAKMAIETSPFSDVFGPKAQRKRVKLSVSTLDDLAEDTEKSLGQYREKREQARLLSGNNAPADPNFDDAPEEEDFSVALAKEPVFTKGQSRRIWNELYRTIDSSDVLIQVLDARDPLGTRCRAVEKYLKTEAPHKHVYDIHLVRDTDTSVDLGHIRPENYDNSLVLETDPWIRNKVDLIPSSVAATWVRLLQKEYPTAAFKANIKNSFGRGSLISLLRQYSILHKDRKQIAVGLVGYPNVGKSSIINALKNKPVCKTAPIPGETKVWQYISLMKRIYLIDCPGIVPPNQNDSPEDLLLRSVVRVENVENPEQYIEGVLKRVKRHHMERTYEVKGWEDSYQFLELLARKNGRLLKGGEPDLTGQSKQVLNDFMRGKIPWFVPPPPVETEEGQVIAGREGRLGEMPMKRKRDELASNPDTSTVAEKSVGGEASEDDEDEFAGFGTNSEPDTSSDAESDAGADADETEGVEAEDIIKLDLSSDEEEVDDDEDDSEGSQEDGESGSGDEADVGLAEELSAGDDSEEAENSRPPPLKRRRSKK